MSTTWRRKGDPYAESFRERHVLGISRIKRWTKRLVVLAVVYGLYLFGAWLILPWGEVVASPQGIPQQVFFHYTACDCDPSAIVVIIEAQEDPRISCIYSELDDVPPENRVIGELPNIGITTH